MIISLIHTCDRAVGTSGDDTINRESIEKLSICSYHVYRPFYDYIRRSNMVAPVAGNNEKMK
jgi:hypothetical protein